MSEPGATVSNASSMATVVSPLYTGAGVAPPGVAIEGYTIVRCLGQGGMGAVYEGIQESTGRRVAIKVMLDGTGDDTGRKRFEREVEVVAKLEHPGIVSIIDSGVRRGQYYFVMEFVEGRTLDEFLKPGECDVRTALACLADICDVVDYAHQRAILHRDLKPGNILVESTGRVKLLDFGIAQVVDDKAAARETVSRPGQVVGTVAYMSPEQAAGRLGDLSIRTDVYALGAIGYEMLTGRLPFPAEGSLAQMVARIATVDPPSLSSIRPRVPRDVDAIILKAMEKQGSRRYSTAGELGADIRRFLAGETVIARPVGVAGLALRMILRNRVVSSVAAASLVVLIVVSTGLIWRIVRERDRAIQNFQQLKQVLESADPESAEGGGTIPQLMDRAAKGLDQSPPKDIQSEADVREIIGGVFRKFGVYEKAAANQRRVLEIRQLKSRGDDPQVADAMHNLAATLWWDGKYAEAEPIYLKALLMRQRLSKGDDAAVAFSMTHLAACRLRLGNVGGARQLYKRALQMRVRLYGEEHEQVAQSLNNLAKCEMETDSIEEAEGSFRKALEMITRLRGAKHLGTASASANLGECMLVGARASVLDGEAARARQRAEEALDLYRSAYEARSAIFTKGHPLAAICLGGMARASLLLGDVEKAAETAEQGLQMVQRTQRPGHPDVMELLAASGTVQSALGNHERAEGELLRAIEIATTIRTASEVRVAELRSELGLVMCRAGNVDAGRRLMQESAAVLSAQRGETSLVAREAAARLASTEPSSAK